MASPTPADAPAVLADLRARRAGAEMSQLQLAERVGVSRQAINAIEMGRQVPSTTLALKLARELRCTVDDLFRLNAGAQIDVELPPARDTGRVVVGRIDNRWVGHALEDPRHTADGVVLGGPDDAGRSRVELLGDLASTGRNVLVAGCAPLLGMLTERLGRHHHEARASWIPANSHATLDLLCRNRVHVGGIHLAQASDASVHAEAARRALPGCRSVLVNLARWRQGLVFVGGNPLGLRTAADVCRPDVRLVCREPGAAAQSLLERAIRASRQAMPAARPGMPIARQHTQVADMVRWGVADVGVAIESAAIAAGLDFIPLAEERFDLLLPEARINVPAVARFMDQIDRPAFRTETHHLPGYDLSAAGHSASVSHAVSTA